MTDVVQLIIQNAVPLIVGLLFTWLCKYLGFIVTEVLNIRTIPLLILVFFMMLVISPAIAGWAALAFFLFLNLLSAGRYLLGPKRGLKIIFAGFYDSSGKEGYFSRSGASKLIDARFIESFTAAINQSGLLEVRPVSVEVFKPHSIIHNWCDHDRFQHLANRYTERSVGTIWGTVDKDGQLQHIDVKVNTPYYHGGQSANDHLDVIIKVLNLTNLRPEEKIQFVAQATGALWGNSFSNDLADSGEWRVALNITQNCIRLVDKAFNIIAEANLLNEKRIVEEIRQILLPNIYIEAARSRLFGEQWLEAFERIVKTIIINPIYPFTNYPDFLRFFEARYKVQITSVSPLKDEVIEAEIATLYDVAELHCVPHLQLLIDCLYEHGRHLDYLPNRIEGWFKTISAADPDNPFVFLYWAEAVKIPSRLGNQPHFKPRIEDLLPIEIMDIAIKKYEEAYRLLPDAGIIATKLGMMWFSSALQYGKGTYEFKRRMNKFEEYIPKAGDHLQELTANWSDEKYDPEKIDSTELSPELTD